MKHVLFIIAICSIGFFTACDYVEQPYPQDGGGPIDTTITYDDTVLSTANIGFKKAIVEEFTGQDCANCPLGAAEALRIDTLYQDSVTIVAVHCTNFAVPNTKYTADFRTDAGNAYEAQFGVSGIPRGVVNRINGQALQAPPSWEADVKSVIANLPIVRVDLINAYSTSDKKLITTVNTEWLNTGSASGYKVVCYIVEDSVASPQNVFGTKDENYIHRHMLRGTLNGEWGTNLPSSGVGDTDSQQFTFDFSTVSWDVKHCEIVAYVYDIDTYEILQVTEAYIKSH